MPASASRRCSSAGPNAATAAMSKPAKAVRKFSRFRRIVSHDSPDWNASRLSRSKITWSPCTGRPHSVSWYGRYSGALSPQGQRSLPSGPGTASRVAGSVMGPLRRAHLALAGRLRRFGRMPGLGCGIALSPTLSRPGWHVRAGWRSRPSLLSGPGGLPRPGRLRRPRGTGRVRRLRRTALSRLGRCWLLTGPHRRLNALRQGTAPRAHIRAGERWRRGLPAQVGHELLKGDDPDVTFPDRLGDPRHRLVGGLHVVAPRVRRRSQQRDVRRGHGAKVERGVVSSLGRKLAAAPGGDQYHGDHDDQTRDQQYDCHI